MVELVWCVPVEGSAWLVVEHVECCGEGLIGVEAEWYAAWEPEAEGPVVLFAGSFLPGCSWITEPDAVIEEFVDVGPVGEFGSSVPGERSAYLLVDGFGPASDCSDDFLARATVREPEQQGVSGGSFEQGHQGGLIVGSTDQVAFPVSEFAAIVDVFGTVGDPPELAEVVA